MAAPPHALPKDVWGPRQWNWLHCSAISYPQRPSPQAIKSMDEHIWRLILGLPCKDCRSHAVAYTKKYPPRLESGQALQRWAWAFHNDVNLRIGKPYMPHDEYLQLYAGESLRTAMGHPI